MEANLSFVIAARAAYYAAIEAEYRLPAGSLSKVATGVDRQGSWLELDAAMFGSSWPAVREWLAAQPQVLIQKISVYSGRYGLTQTSSEAVFAHGVCVEGRVAGRMAGALFGATSSSYRFFIPEPEREPESDQVCAPVPEMRISTRRERRCRWAVSACKARRGQRTR